MRNPIDLLKHRLTELYNEYQRVYNTHYGNSRTAVKCESNRMYYEQQKQDLKTIKDLISEYEISIKLLGELNQYQYLREPK